MENKTNKTNKILVGIIIVLVLIIGLGVGFYFGTMNKKDSSNNINETNKKDSLNNTDETNKKVNTNIKSNVVRLSNDDSRVQTLSKVIGITDTCIEGSGMANNIVNYFGKNTSVDIKSLSNDWKLSFIYALKEYNGYKLVSSYDENSNEWYSEETIKNIYKSLFGDGYLPTKFLVAFDSIEMNYDSAKKMYYYKTGFGSMCGTIMSYSKFDYAEEDGNTINLYANYYVDAVDSGYIYSDYEQNNLVASYSTSEFRDAIFNEYSSKLGKYKYTFVKDNSGNYIFTSVNRIK